MRSRYSAFAVRDAEYLLRTLHPGHPDRGGENKEKSQAIAEIRRSCDAHRYPGLAILDTEGPDREGVARVLFSARVFSGGKDRSFVELSEFAREGEGWRYLSGEAATLEAAGSVDGLKIAGFRELLERLGR
jgi:SEC-C motif-containing protein